MYGSRTSREAMLGEDGDSRGGIAEHALGLVVLPEVEFHLHQNQQPAIDQRSVVRRAPAIEADRSRSSKGRATAANRDP
jgi:hypothetical protein